MGLVIEIQADTAVVAKIHSRCACGVEPDPRHQLAMRFAMLSVSYGGTQINLPFDQLGLLDVGHGLVSTLELGAGQAVAILEWGDRASGIVWINGDGRSAQHGHGTDSRRLAVSYPGSFYHARSGTAFPARGGLRRTALSDDGATARTAHPLMTPTGRSRATFFEIPAWSTTSTTWSTSL